MKEFSLNKDLLHEEYERVEEYVKENVSQTTSVANEKKNQPYNRYQDIGKNN